MTLPSSFLFFGSFLAIILTAEGLSIRSNVTEIDGSSYEFAECMCENGKCVTDFRGKSKCICNPRYVLQSEGVCKECYCGSKGRCYFHYESSKYLKRCLCDKGFAEKEGTCIDCQCGENSKCEFEEDNKICYCLEGYSDLDGVCTACDCGEFGECEFRNGQKHCLCYENFLVLNGKCEECDCGDGDCSFKEGRKVCNCHEGYSLNGDRCEACDCGRYSQGCGFDSAGKKVCTCPSGFSQRLEECATCNCGTNSRSCLFDSVGKTVCTCKKGFAQNGESCQTCNCGTNSVSCAFGGDGNQICGCKSGFAQKGDLCTATCTEDDHCKHDGICVKEGDQGNKFCKCKNGLTGDRCDIIVDCVNGLDAVCRNGGAVCKYNPQTEKGYCECPQDYLFNPKSKQCQVCNCGENSLSCVFVNDGSQLCECKSGFGQRGDRCAATCTNDDQCKYGSRCVSEGNQGHKFCQCKDGLSGDFCEIVVDCDKGLDEVCSNGGGVCTYDWVTELSYCKCQRGWQFNYYLVKECQVCDCGEHGLSCMFSDDDGSQMCRCKPGYVQRGITCTATCNEDNECKHDGKCVNDGNVGNKFCKCKKGLTGDKCDIIVDCVNGLDAVCRNGKGVCIYNPHTEKGYCECQKGSFFNPISQKCQVCDCGGNSVSCIFGGDGSQQCSCKPGFAQKNITCTATCTQDDHCEHDSKCVNEGNKGNRFCKCKNGLSGDKCDIIVDCVNGLDAVCRNGGGICKYNPQTEKAFCECTQGAYFNPISKKCQVCNCGENSVSCLFGEYGNQVCLCKPQFAQKGNKCTATCIQDDHCKNEGRCVNEGNQGSMFCKCKNGLTGDKCDIIVDCVNGLEVVCRNGGGSCKYNPQTEKAYCECPVGKSFNPTSKRCEGCNCGPNSVSCAFGEDGNEICRCKSGFAQRGKNTCSTTCTQDDHCNHDSKCVNEGNGGYKFCKCKNGLTGDKCDIIVDCVNGLDAVCRNGGGICKYNPQTEKAFCECPQGSYFNPISKKCQVCNCGENSLSCSFGGDGNQVCQCKAGFAQRGYRCSAICSQDNNCKNDGRCVNEGNRGDKFCKCKNGLTGDKCDIIVDCVNGLDAVCRNGGGVCKYNPKTEKAYCECQSGMLFNPRSKRCEACSCGANSVSCSFGEDGHEICRCRPGYGQRGNNTCSVSCNNDNDCKNGGKCVTEGRYGAKFCKCGEGVIGDKCEIIVACKEEMIMRCRSAGALCRYNEEKRTTYCKCPENRIFNPYSDMCEEGNCRPETCYGGRCQLIENELLCVCPKGYRVEGIGCFGIMCKQKRCDGGVCKVVHAQEICTCHKGYVLKDDVCVLDFVEFLSRNMLK